VHDGLLSDHADEQAACVMHYAQLCLNTYCYKQRVCVLNSLVVLLIIHAAAGYNVPATGCGLFLTCTEIRHHILSASVDVAVVANVLLSSQMQAAYCTVMYQAKDATASPCKGCYKSHLKHVHCNETCLLSCWGFLQVSAHADHCTAAAQAQQHRCSSTTEYYCAHALTAADALQAYLLHLLRGAAATRELRLEDSIACGVLGNCWTGHYSNFERKCAAGRH
jgi:hypothetical protein